MPRCYRCGHPIADAWSEQFWSDANDDYIACCTRCQHLEEHVVRAILAIKRVYFETAIGRIPKKRKTVTP